MHGPSFHKKSTVPVKIYPRREAYAIIRMEVRSMQEKPRVSRHNGRAGKHGVYNPKHNDRSFDVENADNIIKDRTSLNLYWDCQNGLRTHEENSTGQYWASVRNMGLWWKLKLSMAAEKAAKK